MDRLSFRSTGMRASSIWRRPFLAVAGQGMRAFSLLEVTVAMGLAGAFALAGIMAYSYVTEGIAITEARKDADDLSMLTFKRIRKYFRTRDTSLAGSGFELLTGGAGLPFKKIDIDRTIEATGGNLADQLLVETTCEPRGGNFRPMSSCGTACASGELPVTTITTETQGSTAVDRVYPNADYMRRSASVIGLETCFTEGPNLIVTVITAYYRNLGSENVGGVVYDGVSSKTYTFHLPKNTVMPSGAVLIP